MALTEIVKLIQRKGLKVDLPVLDEAEFGFATDTEELFIGSSTGNILLAKKADIPLDSGNNGSTVVDGSTNGRILVDGVEMVVYDDTALQLALNGKANVEHSHYLSDLNDIDVTNKTNGYALIYDSTLGKFASKAMPSGSGSGATSLDELTDVDTSTVVPSEGNSLVFEGGMWKPKNVSSPMTSHKGLTYIIELDRWGIKKDGTQPDATAKGLNNAIQWAKENGYDHAYLPAGHYFVRVQTFPKWGDWSKGVEAGVVLMPNDFHFELDKDALIELESNSWSNYNVIAFHKVKNSRVSGGKIKGDRKTHTKELYVGFERGGVNSDGSLNTDQNWIRTQPLDRLSNGVLSLFRVWKHELFPNATGYHFAQYKDTVSTTTLAGYRDNGQFAPTAPTGRGWFGTPIEANKLIITINIANDPITDSQLSALKVKIDNQYYAHEGGHCVGVYGGLNIEIDHMELFNAMGDGIQTGVGYEYKGDGVYPDLVKLQEDMGRYVYIHHNNIHRNRRQGISLCGPNDQFVYENDIHHIGKDDDGVTPDFTAPAFGIDIESMIGESNVPAKHLYYGRDGVEVNFRINVFNNYVHHNERGHFVNPDGSYVTVKNNIFEGGNIGGINSDYRYKYVKFLDNTYIGCEQWVTGDNVVQGAILEKGNIRLSTCEGATITNIRIKDGIFYGNANYGYFGTPTVDVATSTFSFSTPHGMGNTAKVSFENWAGKVPKGIQTNKIYYVVNQQTNSFQVSETEGGKAVVFYDSGESGFIVSRYNYGRLFIDGVTVERDYRTDIKAFDVALSGATIKNLIVKNCNATIAGSSINYCGRPITIEGMTVIDGTTQLSNCQLSNGKFISNHGDTVSLGTDNNYNKFYGVNISDATFVNQTVLMGDATVRNSRFSKSRLTKENNNHKSVVIDSFIEDSTIKTVWASQPKVFLVTGCTTSKMTIETSGSDANALQLIGNTDIATSIVDKTPTIISVSPDPSIYATQQSVTLTCASASSIRYTVDGSEPTTTSTLYSSPISISSPTIVKAIALDSNSTIIAKKSWFYDVDLIAPEDVTNLATSSIRNSDATLTWTTSIASDKVSYEVYIGSTLAKTVPASTTTVLVEGLLANTQYTLTVKTVDDAGNKSAGVSVVITTNNDSTPPEEVTSIMASLVSDTNIGLTWIPSVAPDIYSYEVYNGATLLGESVSANFAINNLTPSTSYTFTVKAKDKNGNVSTGVPFTVSTSSAPVNSFSGYVKNGLVLFNKDVTAGTSIANKNSYFVGTGNFTATFLLKHDANTTLLTRRSLGVLKDSSIVIDTANWGASNAYAQVTLWGKNLLDGTYKQLTSSNLNTNDTDMFGKMESGAYYTLTLRRSGNNIKIYLNGMDYTVLAPFSTMNIDPNYSYINGDAAPSLVIGNSAHAATSHYKAVLYYNRDLTNEEITQNFQALFDAVPPNTLSNLNVTSTTAQIADLTWIDPTDTDILYKNVYYKKSTDATWTKSNTTRISGQSYQVSGLMSGIGYDFKVEVVDNHLNKTSSNIVSLTVA